MEPNKTSLEVAQCRFAEADARVREHLAQVTNLARKGLDMTEARATLAASETTLRLTLEDLIRERDRAAGNQP